MRCTPRRILEATVKAVKLPVTLKMRTGWDSNNRNAPNLARIAEQCGIKMLTVHGRTRCQFYDGQADWAFVANVKAGHPASGHRQRRHQLARRRRRRPRAIGRRWRDDRTRRLWPAVVPEPGDPLPADRRTAGRSVARRAVRHRCAGTSSPCCRITASETGVRMARKHLGWYSKGLPASAEFRAAVNRETDPNKVRAPAGVVLPAGPRTAGRLSMALASSQELECAQRSVPDGDPRLAVGGGRGGRCRRARSTTPTSRPSSSSASAARASSAIR